MVVAHEIAETELEHVREAVVACPENAIEFQG